MEDINKVYLKKILSNINNRIDIADYYYSFKNEIINNNRFFPKHKIIDVLKESYKNNIFILEKGSTLYRSRIYTLPLSPNFLNNNAYSGYDAENSLAPKNKNIIRAGRANPEKIGYLYLSEDVETSIKEIRPNIKSRISVATVEILKDFKLFDISDLNQNLKEFEALNFGFSLPVSNEIDYIPTQYISEFLKNIGFDGIKFNSSLNKNKKNITLFNYENNVNIQFIKSELYFVNDINVDFSNLNNMQNMINNILKELMSDKEINIINGD
ncbi:RES domain-containing protein [Brachyspira pilosicoli]|uniref:RES family NAD+ phosphorylase n=1 Tax=Brachyspira pilosicoli TaxID=52584 RepID=UPI000E150E9D|nr:RES family NAD+ phosphorylase [Brachyspira pilosicoli]SUW07653.1 RES domain-containing protein [Brachyspira pilosicoli]